MSENKYHYINHEKQEIGPVTLKELKALKLHPETLVWKQGPDNWKQAREIKELYGTRLSRRTKAKIILNLIAFLMLAILIYCIIKHRL